MVHTRYIGASQVSPWVRRAGSALAGTAAAELVARTLGATGPIDAASRFVVDTVPVPVVEITVHRLGRFDKDATRLSVLASVAAAGALLRGPRVRPTAVVGLSTLGAALAVRRPPRRAGATALSALAGAAAGLVSDRLPPVLPAALVGAAALAERRARRLAATVVRGPLPAVCDGAEGWPAATPLVTPTPDFYVTDVNLGPPRIDPGAHVLEVVGDVERPLRLGVEDLRSLAEDPFTSLLICIHNRVGGRRLGNAVWQGVALDRIIDLVGPTPDARFVSTVAVDGFRATIPLDLLREEGFGGWVVFAMNGSDLTPPHGGPIRFLVPGLYGQYNGAKWLSRLEFRRRHPGDYWTGRGWSHGPIPVQVGSRLDPPVVHPGGVSVTGVAWAPPHGISRVDLLVDGRAVPTELAAEVDPRSWRRFRADLDLEPGRHRIAVRATSALGVEQTEVRRPPFPAGATGLHVVEVDVA